MRLVLLGGSLRPPSLNTRLLRHLAAELETRGHEVASFTGPALSFPLYTEGEPPTADLQELRGRLGKAQGLVIVSPEYNSGIPGHLKNAVDWLSTMAPSPWPGLPLLLCAASPGAFGGARGLVAWRATLANMGAVAFPGAITVPHADQQLDERGAPTDPRTAASVSKTLAGFLALAARLHPE
jgi:chromate reductase